jgi:hypothetical protein
MFAETSRYAGLEILTVAGLDGASIPYVSRRFLPRADRLSTLQEVSPTPGERLDMIATRTMGDPAQYWRICDANDAMNPPQLLASPGHRLKVPLPYLQNSGVSGVADEPPRTSSAATQMPARVSVV